MVDKEDMLVSEMLKKFPTKKYTLGRILFRSKIFQALDPTTLPYSEIVRVRGLMLPFFRATFAMVFM